MTVVTLQGNWTLHIVDNAGDDIGILIHWKMELCWSANEVTTGVVTSGIQSLTTGILDEKSEGISSSSTKLVVALAMYVILTLL